MIPVAAPPRVRQRLASYDGPVRVLHRAREAAYVDVGGWAVGVLARDAAHVPCGLRSRLPASALAECARAEKSGYLEDGTLWLGGQAFRPVRTVDVRAPRIAVDDGFRTANSATVTATPPAQVAEFVRGVAVVEPDGLDDARAAALVPSLIGAGPGLTPLGDDLLCGWIAACRAAGMGTPLVDAAVRKLLPSTTTLSATLLDCASAGEVLPELGTWLAALGTPAEGSRLTALRSVGATSGAGLAEGARLALLSLSSPASSLAKVAS